MTTEAADTTTIGGGWLSRFGLEPGEDVLVDFPVKLYGAIWSFVHHGRLYVTDRRLIWLSYRWFPYRRRSLVITYERVRKCELVPGGTWSLDTVTVRLRNMEEYWLIAARSTWSSTWIDHRHSWPAGWILGGSIVSAEMYEEIEEARARFAAMSEADAS
jgi:hypothetical protein